MNGKCSENAVGQVKQHRLVQTPDQKNGFPDHYGVQEEFLR